MRRELHIKHFETVEFTGLDLSSDDATYFNQGF